MPKFRKETEKGKKKKRKQRSEENFAFKSIIISAMIGGIFLVISLILNGTEEFFEGILNHFLDEDLKYQTGETTINVSEILDNTMKVSVILLCFFLFFISIANYKDLSGKPAMLKDGILLGLLALLQTVRNFWVFLYTLIGLIGILVYLYFVQDVESTE